MGKTKTKKYYITTTHGTFYCDGIYVKCFKDNETGETFLVVVDKVLKNGDFHYNTAFNIQHVVSWKDISEEE